MELTTITRRVAEMCGIEASSVEPDPRFVGPAGWQGREEEAALAGEQKAEAAAHVAAPAPPARVEPLAIATPADLARARAAEARAPVDRSAYATVQTLDELGGFLARAQETGLIAFDVQASSPDPMRAELIGLSLAVAPGRPATFRSPTGQGRTIFSAAAGSSRDRFEKRTSSRS